jgi:riboflavin synthase
MFTGLIETTGEIKSFSLENKSALIAVVPKTADFECKIGDSVAINAVCLTIEKINGKELFFRAVNETLSRTTHSKIGISQIVNLERAMKVDGRFDGHIVLGHVDAVGKIENIRKDGDSTLFSFSLSDEYFKYIAKKGSIAIDGISLTVADLTDRGFILSIIPHTLKNTNLLYKKVGDFVNVECDVFARYIERMLENRENKNEKMINLLKEGGF